MGKRAPASKFYGGRKSHAWNSSNGSGFGTEKSTRGGGSDDSIRVAKEEQVALNSRTPIVPSCLGSVEITLDLSLKVPRAMTSPRRQGWRRHISDAEKDKANNLEKRNKVFYWQQHRKADDRGARPWRFEGKTVKSAWNPVMKMSLEPRGNVELGDGMMGLREHRTMSPLRENARRWDPDTSGDVKPKHREGRHVSHATNDGQILSLSRAGVKRCWEASHNLYKLSQPENNIMMKKIRGEIGKKAENYRRPQMSQQGGQSIRSKIKDRNSKIYAVSGNLMLIQTLLPLP